MKKKLSIHDIAKHLKVSATTVSFDLNRKTKAMRISKEVEKKGLQCLKVTSYQPNLNANKLRIGRSRMIELMVEGIANPFLYTISYGIEHRVYKPGYNLFFASTENATEKARSFVKVFREMQVNAYVIAFLRSIPMKLKPSLQMKALPVDCSLLLLPL